MEYEPTDGTWRLSENANSLREIQSSYPDGWLQQQVDSLKWAMCEYFSVGDCNSKQGKSISPMGLTQDGGKILKVRWLLPGKGKSGGLRLCVVVYCDRREVVVADGWVRKDDVSSQPYFDAANEA